MYQRPDGGLSKPAAGLTSLKIVTRRDAVSHLFRPRWRALAASAARVASLTLVIVAGSVWTMEHQHPHFTRPAALLEVPRAVLMAPKPNEDPFRIGQVLRRYTKNGDVADKIALAVVAEGKRKKIDPALLVGVILVESDNLNTHARSSVGARGLMQVMPFHRGQWGCKSNDLYSIEGNVCHGVSVLADAIKRAPNLQTALLRYNGCVRGTNTPGCRSYSGKVFKAADRTTFQLMAMSPRAEPQE